MKILMIAPEPFFEPRGTPFSEYYRIQSLIRLGHTVDLVTYPLGRDVEMEGLRIIRSLRVPGIRRIKTGPSFAKLPLDFFLFFRAWRQLRQETYHLIHSHEEANIMGVFLGRRFRIPHLYDMHSSLVQQMDNFKFTRLKMVIGFFRRIENVTLKTAAGVIVICRSLYDYASRLVPSERLTLIENFMDEYQRGRVSEAEVSALRRTLAGKKEKIILYTGTLETYQGMPLLLKSLRLLPEEYRMVLVGGNPVQIREIHRLAERRGVEKRVRTEGRQPPDRIPLYLKAADVLVSPRVRGTNIPLKVYSYLKSGVPLVATRLYTHTQTLTDDIAVLAEPEPEAFARGIREAIGFRGREVADKALQFCRSHYTRDRYDRLVASSLDKVL